MQKILFENNLLTARSIVDQIYKKYSQKDIDGMLELLDPSIKWSLNSSPEQCPISGTFYGPDGVRGCVEQDFLQIESLEFKPIEYFVSSCSTTNSYVNVIGTGRYRIKKTNEIFKGAWTHFFVIENNKVARLEMFINVTLEK